MTDELKAKFTDAAGDGFITMQEATRALGVTRQTVLQRVKRGEIEAAHVSQKQKRITDQSDRAPTHPLRPHLITLRAV